LNRYLAHLPPESPEQLAAPPQSKMTLK